MNDSLHKLLKVIDDNNGINDKSRLAKIVAEQFNLTKDRSVYYCHQFAVRFCSSASRNFGNTVLSLSNLQKYDDRPFIVCVITPSMNYCLLSNSTLLKKISHSSQELRVNNIRGSFNGSDIVRKLDGIDNITDNFERLYNIHMAMNWEENLIRLVEETNNISPSGVKYNVNKESASLILGAPERAKKFIESEDYTVLKCELDEKVNKFKTEIMLAALIENVNVRGRIIEYIIAGNDEVLRQQIILALKNGENGIPLFKTENALGDYKRNFNWYDTETDVKTKIMILNSNPKAYNIDKMLEFLDSNRSVFMFYFVGVEPGKIVNTTLVSMFQEKLLKSTVVLRHWAGRNSRGVTQFEGRTINGLIKYPDNVINKNESVEFLNKIIAL